MRCTNGQRLYAEAANCRGTIDDRQIAWVAYQDHWLKCKQCADHRDAEWKAAGRLAPVPHEVTK